MFNAKNTQIISLIVVIVSVITCTICFFMMANYSGLALLSLLSNLFYFLCGYFGLKLSKYDLQEREFKTIGIRLLIAMNLCLVNLFLTGLISFIISVVIFGSFYALKSNYDEWEQKKKDREAKTK
jgi:peptidoglycan biosynthesis protein MviN/MurJ (putative lipid II flippase)